MCTNGFEGYHRNSGRRIRPRSMIRLKRFSEILMIPYRLHNSQVESLSKCEKKKNRVDSIRQIRIYQKSRTQFLNANCKNLTIHHIK